MEPLTESDQRQVRTCGLHSRLGSTGWAKSSWHLRRWLVALKIINPRFSRAREFINRFRCEVKGAQTVNGAYTAQVLGELDLTMTALALPRHMSQAPGCRKLLGFLPEEVVWKLAGGLLEARSAIYAEASCTET